MAGGHTFSNSPVACAVGQTVIDVIRSEDVLTSVERRGAELGRRLREVAEEFPYVGDVRGVGFMWGIELVTDRESLSPPDPSLEVTGKVVATAASHGLVVYPSRACHDGVNGDAVMVAPPLTISEAEMDELIQRLRATLQALRPFFAGAVFGAGKTKMQEEKRKS
jgi:4-aminobutyrate aminotransferase-like enzyme